MAVALTAHPLSADYRRRLEAAIGVEPEYVTLSHLRRESPATILRTLGRLQRRACFLPLEDQASRVVLPVLEAVASTLRPRSLEVVGPELERQRISRFTAVPSLAAVGVATLDGRRALRRARSQIAELQRARRSSVSFEVAPRVVHVNGNLWFGVKAGGSVGHIAGVANGFAENGYDVELVAVAAPPTAMHERVRFTPFSAPSAFGLPPEVNTYRVQPEIERVASAALTGSRSGILYQRHSLATHAGARAAHRLGVPYVVEYNGSEVWVQRNWGRRLAYEELALAGEEVTLAHAHLVVTVSEVLRDELVERGVARERIVWYPNCFDPAVFDPGRFDADASAQLRAEHGIAKDAVVAMFLGTFGEWHGVDVLAQAIRRLRDRHADWLERTRLHFMLVGDGLRMPEVRAILGEDNPFCTLTGLVPQDRAPAYLAAADLVLSPHRANADSSRFFGSPTKLFEYMGMAKPIVASRLDQLADVLTPSLDAADLPAEPGTTDAIAVLARPGDVDELVDGIRFFADQPEWRRALGENARARALDRYTWNHHVAAILEGLNAVSELRE